jgi:hypothetical protein
MVFAVKILICCVQFEFQNVNSVTKFDVVKQSWNVGDIDWRVFYVGGVELIQKTLSQQLCSFGVGNDRCWRPSTAAQHAAEKADKRVDQLWLVRDVGRHDRLRIRVANRRQIGVVVLKKVDHHRSMRTRRRTTQLLQIQLDVVYGVVQNQRRIVDKRHVKRSATHEQRVERRATAELHTAPIVDQVAAIVLQILGQYQRRVPNGQSSRRYRSIGRDANCQVVVLVVIVGLRGVATTKHENLISKLLFDKLCRFRIVQHALDKRLVQLDIKLGVLLQKARQKQLLIGQRSMKLMTKLRRNHFKNKILVCNKVL